MKKIILIFLIILSVNFLSPTIILAGPKDPMVPMPGSGDETGFGLANFLYLGKTGVPLAGIYKNPAILINVIVRNLMILAGVILFITIINVGFKFVTGGKKSIEDAKTILKVALTGFLIMFAAYWIMQILAKITGADILF